MDNPFYIPEQQTSGNPLYAPDDTAPSDSGANPLYEAGDNILDKPTSVTQSFGTVNPIEPTSGHKAGDTNFAASANDSVKAPPGKWTVIRSYNQANPQGSPGDYIDNSGWGNDVWLQNEKGQTLHFLHLAQANANPGDIVEGGSIVGSVGSSGNATGSNLGVEYYDANGNLNDFEQSPYAQYLDK